MMGRRGAWLSGALLVGGAVAVFAAAGMPLRGVWTAGGPQAITSIAQQLTAWRWANGLFATGLALTVAGLSGVTSLLRGNRPWAVLADIGLATYLLAAPLWLVSLVFRLTVAVTVADGVLRGAPVPDWYTPLAGSAEGLLNVYHAIASLALIAIGLSIMRSELVPRWVGWFTAAIGIVLGATLLFGSSIPALLYIPSGVIGAALLLRAWRSPAKGAGSPSATGCGW